MKTEKQIRTLIRTIKQQNRYCLKGELSSIQINAPRALIQLHAEAQLSVLHWVLGEKFTSKLKGPQ